MKRLLSITGILLDLLALIVLLLALALTFGGLRRGAEPVSWMFQSPIETPTQPPYPPPTPTRPSSKPTPVTPPPTIPPKPSPPTVTVTLPPYPPPQTPTPPETPTTVPTPQATVTPPAPGTPTAVPTPPGPLPPGPKVVYSENLHDGTVLFWVASTVNPDLRRILTTIMDPTDFGINATLSHDQTRIAYTVLPSGVGHNHFAAELWVMNVDGSKRQMLADRIDIGNPLNYPLWSPDDRYLAFRRQTAKEAPFTQTINIIDVQSGEETILVSADETTWLWPLGWSVDGRYVYYKQGATDGVQLRRVDIGNRVSQNVTLIEGAIPACHFFSPDRQWLLCTILQTRRPPSYAVITVPISPEPLRQIVSGASGETGYYQPIWGPGSQEITVNIPPAASTLPL